MAIEKLIPRCARAVHPSAHNCCGLATQLSAWRIKALRGSLNSKRTASPISRNAARWSSRLRGPGLASHSTPSEPYAASEAQRSKPLAGSGAEIVSIPREEALDAVPRPGTVSSIHFIKFCRPSLSNSEDSPVVSLPSSWPDTAAFEQASKWCWCAAAISRTWIWRVCCDGGVGAADGARLELPR